MKKVKKQSLPKEARSMYRRIKKTRARAQWVGFFYLIATIALAGLAVLPTLNVDYLSVVPGLVDGGKMLWEDLNGLGANVDTISRVLYVIMLLTVVINVLKSFGKLGWLYKKKASKTYGFNRNVYAMQDMGRYFSSSLATILIINVLIALLNGSYAGADKLKFDGLETLLAGFIVEIAVGPITITNALVIVAVGVLFRLFCGFLGAKVSMFTAEEGIGVSEQRREVGRFAPLFRNFLQLIVSLAIPMFLLQVNKIDAFVADALGGTINIDIPAILQLAIFLFWMVLVTHATNTTEYNAEGAEGKGMANFKWFIFLTLGASAALYYMEDSAFSFDLKNVTYFNTLMIAAISFVMFVIEILMRKAPGYPEEVSESAAEQEVLYDENGNPIVAAAEEVVVEVDDVDWRYFFSDSFVGGEVTGEVVE